MTQERNSTRDLRLAIFGAILALAFLAWAVPSFAEPPPFAGPEARGQCPKGWVKRKGDCWRRTTDDISVFQTPEDEEYWQPDLLSRFLDDLLQNTERKRGR